MSNSAKVSGSEVIRLSRETKFLLERVCRVLDCNRDEAIRMALEAIYATELERRVDWERGEETTLSKDELSELLDYL